MEKPRYMELDITKGIAILLVVIYHFVFDLSYLANVNIDPFSLFWQTIANIAAILFILTAGVSLVICKQYSPHGFTWKIFVRSIQLLLLALLITLVTALYVGNGTIYFGILHFLAVAPFLSLWCLRSPFLPLVTAVFIFSISHWVQSIQIPSYALLWLGIQPHHFQTLDYFPLIPWLGVYLLGIGTGHLINPYFRTFHQPTIAFLVHHPVSQALAYIGRHTLLIYMIHQPILFLLFHLYLQR